METYKRGQQVFFELIVESECVACALEPLDALDELRDHLKLFVVDQFSVPSVI